MSIRDFNWSPEEKKIARAAFDKAYQKEMTGIKNELEKRIKNLDDLQKVWSIHDYLNKRRNEIDRKYDYRYSVLINVFVRLLSEGYIEEKDLEGLSEDKLNAIKFLTQ
ncbi:MAG: hypothetical protein WAV89_16425 [Ignavibacteriaceae bacterium]